MIKIRCKNCDQKIKVPDIHAGKKGKCPKCKSIVVIPKIKAADFPNDRRNSLENSHQSFSLLVSDLPLEKKPPDQTKKTNKVFANDFEVTQYDERLIKIDQTEKPPVRKLPWLLDIFLYPTSMSGLINLGIFWLLPVLIRVFTILLPGRIVWLLGFLVGLVISAYMYYYFMECIRDSAKGGIRAPENIASLPDMSEALSDLMEIVACFVIFWGLVGFYFLFTRKIDTIFLLLLGYGIFFFPMGLLALAMFRSTAAFNPFVWIMSILSTFVQYCGLVLFFCILGWLVSGIMSSFQGSLFFSFLFNAIFIYLAMVGAHLLGRFYYLNSETLNWEV